MVQAVRWVGESGRKTEMTGDGGRVVLRMPRPLLPDRPPRWTRLCRCHSLVRPPQTSAVADGETCSFFFFFGGVRTTGSVLFCFLLQLHQSQECPSHLTMPLAVIPNISCAQTNLCCQTHALALDGAVPVGASEN